jgi:Family of unknown function (DUF5681)
MSEGKDYPVGYKKPPPATRFKPGQSGNPKGRPKGAKNFSTAIQAELDTHIVATENGRRRKITKRAAVAKQLVNKAVSGDQKAIPLLFNECRQIEDQPLAGSAESVFDRPEDHSVMESIKRRILAAAREEQELPAVEPPHPSPEEPTSKPEDPQ